MPHEGNRHTIRYKKHDYSYESTYFITICVQKRMPLFGKINDGKLYSNEPGIMILNEWNKIASRFPHIQLGERIMMPDHFHAILTLKPFFDQDFNNGNSIQGLGSVIGAFKSITTKRYIDGVINLNWEPFFGKLWQRNYFEMIIRNPEEEKKYVQYIRNNPKIRKKR